MQTRRMPPPWIATAACTPGSGPAVPVPSHQSVAHIRCARTQCYLKDGIRRSDEDGLAGAGSTKENTVEIGHCDREYHMQSQRPGLSGSGSGSLGARAGPGSSQADSESGGRGRDSEPA